MRKIEENIPLANFTTFKIGGPARYFIKTESIEDLIYAIDFAKSKNEDVFILGGGSNVLISDNGFNGLVINIPVHGWKNSEHNLDVHDSRVYFDAGISLSRLISFTFQNELTGFEWAVGIPGTLGGAVRGNSGAFGKGTGDFVETVDAFDASTMKIKKLSKEECGFYYRGSKFRKNKNLIILRGVFNLKKDDKENIQARMKEFLLDRAKNNSVSLGKSAGCFFKNIPWENVNKNYLTQNFPEIKAKADSPKIPTGYLIDYVGLKGAEIGGALVPNEHANYIINKNNATAADVLNLADLIREKIYDKYKIKLEEEVELVGF